MLEWIEKYWLQELFGLMIAALGVAIKRLSNKIKKSKEQEAAEKEALLSLLDDSMGTLSDRCKERGYATREEARRYERMYQAYHGLGGNGAVTNEHAQFMKLDVRIQ